jgi:hypothetical protein
MINPGASPAGSRRGSDFETHQSEWESVAQRGDQEFANHSAHHRGGLGDEDMEAEVGEAAQAIWKLRPGQSKLTALNLGGGTRWETTRTLRYYLDKFYQFDASENSTGMDDSYGNRVANFRRLLEQHLQRGLWCRVHYHAIGDGLSSSEANFRAVLDIVHEYQAKLWIAGMADIHKYQTERNAARLVLLRSDPRGCTFQFAGETSNALYDQPLTLEVDLLRASDASRITMKDAQGGVIPVRAARVAETSVLRFEVPPRNAIYSLEISL